MHPTIWKASGHVDAFNDPLIDNKDSKNVIAQMFWLKIIWLNLTRRLTKRLVKAAKRFGESFDEAQFRATNPRVLENQAKGMKYMPALQKDLNDNFEDLSGSYHRMRNSMSDIRYQKLDRCTSSSIWCFLPKWDLQPTAPWRCTFVPKLLRVFLLISECAENRPYENSVWYCTDR